MLDTHVLTSCLPTAYQVALQENPAVNAVIDDGHIVYRDYVDISIAVSSARRPQESPAGRSHQIERAPARTAAPIESPPPCTALPERKRRRHVWSRSAQSACLRWRVAAALGRASCVGKSPVVSSSGDAPPSPAISRHLPSSPPTQVPQRTDRARAARCGEDGVRRHRAGATAPWHCRHPLPGIAITPLQCDGPPYPSMCAAACAPDVHRMCIACA